jgi:hypothetical protein
MELLALDKIESDEDIKPFFKKQHLLYNYCKVSDEDVVIANDGSWNILQIANECKINLVREIIKGIGFSGISMTRIKEILSERFNSPAVQKMFSEKAGILHNTECND